VILGFIPRGRHLLAFDVVATALGIVIAFAMRFDASNIVATIGPYLPVALLPLLTYPPTYVAFGLYRREWRYASVREMYAIAAAVSVATIVTVAVFLVLAVADAPGTIGFPRSVFAIEALVNVALVGGGRFLLRASLERGNDQDGESSTLTLIYGAGEAGATVARLAERDRDTGLRVVGFLDDDRRKKNSQLLGKRVFGGLDALEPAVNRTGARQLIVAMPSAPGSAVRKALAAGRELGLELRTIPPLRELVTGTVQLSMIRRVRVDDLLRREPVVIDTSAIEVSLNGASVLVTGGGGSIGSELVRQILAIGPRLLTVVDNSEWALWSVEREIATADRSAEGPHVEAVLGDVRSAAGIESIVRKAKPDIVFHAAALKHVPLVERHPVEGALTNVLGTRNVLAACERAETPRFVLISTDKAVEPTSVMGATKRLAELMTLDSAQRTSRPYVAVRFGNVLGSSGSVVPTFERQLEAGGPLTVTHLDATRYFMTISEAVSLILEAGTTASSGEISVLDMGEPIRIVDLARDLINLAGMDPDHIGIAFTGLRPGERLHESLFYEAERAERTGHEGILRVAAPETPTGASDLAHLVAQLEAAIRDGDERAVRELLKLEPLTGRVPSPLTVG
jgi:FlaA1/EpsC-like NDP-sugar epimerase